MNRTPSVGYNTSFVYPREGLDILVRKLAERCEVHYRKKVIGLDLGRKQVHFADGSGLHYERLVSTLPLNRIVEMTGLKIDSDPDPYTSVLVLNIGGERGSKCPDDHWLYIPVSKSGFHRVGFYSNVDESFLPASPTASQTRVSIYLERAYPGGAKPDDSDVRTYTQAAVQELQEWGFIKSTEIVDPTWIDVAYTWASPGSSWKQRTLKALEEHDIYQVGRYGRWKFQGVAESIRDGFTAGTCLRAI